MFSSEQLGRLTDLFVKYLEVKSEVIKEQAKAHVAKVISNLLVLLMFVGIAFLIVLLGGFALSFYLNDSLDSSYLGFLIVMGVFFLSSIVLYGLRKNLIRAFIYRTISKYFDDERNVK